MGRNFWSVCDHCMASLMHLRGKESDHMQEFARAHSQHERFTRVLNDYVEEPPEHYTDVSDLRLDVSQSQANGMNTSPSNPNPAQYKLKEE